MEYYYPSLPKVHRMFLKRVNFLILINLIYFTGWSQQVTKYPPVDLQPFRDSEHHWYAINNEENVVTPKPNQPRYRPTELIEIGDNILLFQKRNGGWPKNYDMLAILTDKQKKKLEHVKNDQNTTFDNSTTYTHIACLSMIYRETKINKYKEAALKGIEFILTSQYPNGGWPQYYPLKDDYSRYVTYNDDVIAGIMKLLKDILDEKPDYNYVDAVVKQKLKHAFDKGLQCILKTQITDNGSLTAWCQQYDEKSLRTAWARKFEPPSICNGESCGVLELLMSLQNPDKDVIKSVSSAVRWFNESKINGVRVKTIEAPLTAYKYRVSHTDKIVVPDTAALPIWTRYYELETHRPLFCNRDSKVVYSLAEVERERRDGYRWYTYEPQKILNSYPGWAQKWVK